MSEALQPSAASVRWPLPFTLALGSSVAAIIATVVVLHEVPSDDGSSEHERTLTLTPERAAESFVAAYTAAAYERASHFATGTLARKLRAQARQERLAGTAKATPMRSLLIEESFFLTQGRLRLTGLATPGDANLAAHAYAGAERGAEAQAAARDDWPVSLILSRDGDRFLVDELTWPKGQPPEAR